MEVVHQHSTYMKEVKVMNEQKEKPTKKDGKSRLAGITVTIGGNMPTEENQSKTDNLNAGEQ